MVSRKTNSKDTVSDRNCNNRISLILEKFRRNRFSRITNFENFMGINVRESAFSGVKKWIYFREFSQNRNFLPAKISSLKVWFDNKELTFLPEAFITFWNSNLPFVYFHLVNSFSTTSSPINISLLSNFFCKSALIFSFDLCTGKDTFEDPGNFLILLLIVTFLCKNGLKSLTSIWFASSSCLTTWFPDCEATGISYLRASCDRLS